MVEVEYDDRALVEALGRVDDNLEHSLPQVIAMGCDLIAAHAKEHHEYKDGPTSALTNSIQPAGVTGSFKAGTLEGTVAAGAPYASAIEHGSRPHKIRARNRKALRWVVPAGFRFAVEVNHPGNRAYRFLENALDAQMPTITEEMEAAVDLAFFDAGLG